MIESGRRNIVVLGAGFGGITALLKLRRGLRHHDLSRRYQLVLVNRTAHHLYTPALYEIAAIPKDAADAPRLKPSICIPIDDILKRCPDIRFIGETAVGLDAGRHELTFSSGSRISFEYLVIALGAETNFFGISGMAEHALPIKTFTDAVRLRNRIEDVGREVAGPLDVIVAGGGATGVELSAELVNFLCRIRGRGVGSRCQENITLVEAGPEILAGFDAAIVRHARRRLESLGVAIMTGRRISEVRPAELLLSGTSGAAADEKRILPYHLLIWAGGVRPATALSNFGLALDRKGGVVVDRFLEAKPAPAGGIRDAAAPGRIYAIGDNASFARPDGTLVPGNVPAAEAGGRIAAQNIIAHITGNTRRPFQPPKRYPFILAVGKKYALADLVIIQCFGFLGWAIKQIVELHYLLFILPWRRATVTWLRTVYYSTRND